MTKQDFIRKLSSRKFWAMVAGLVTSILLLINMGPGETEKIIAVIGAFGSIIAYILGESTVDVAGVKDGTK